MKKQLLSLCVGFLSFASVSQAQVSLFDRLDANAGANKEINFRSAPNYYHRITNYNVGTNRADLRFQASRGSTFFYDIMTITTDGKVGIGTMFANVTAGDFHDYNLFVTGGIRTEKVKIDLSTGWADYVFDASYRLRSLPELETFIKQHKHLPDVPSAQELKEKGIDVADMQKIQMQKIEELTLYVIELKKEIEILKTKLYNNEK